MHHVLRRLIAASATLILLLSPDAAQAQATMTITGRVTSNGQPLGGTQVGIVELAAGAVTDQQGRYSFTIDPARASKPVSLLARTIGYRPIRRSITLTAGRSEQNFELEKDVLNLETVVTTGVSDARRRRRRPSRWPRSTMRRSRKRRPRPRSGPSPAAWLVRV